MYDMKEVADLLVVHQRKLRELTYLIELFSEDAYGRVPSLQYRCVMASAQRPRSTGERAQRIYKSLAPYLRRNIIELEREAETLRQTLKGMSIQSSEAR